MSIASSGREQDVAATHVRDASDRCFDGARHSAGESAAAQSDAYRHETGAGMEQLEQLQRQRQRSEGRGSGAGHGLERPREARLPVHQSGRWLVRVPGRIRAARQQTAPPRRTHRGSVGDLDSQQPVRGARIGQWHQDAGRPCTPPRVEIGIYLTPGISAEAVAKDTPVEGNAAGRLTGKPSGYTARQIATRTPEQNYNCGGSGREAGGMVGLNFSSPGTQLFVNSWADTLASWGVDFVKLDGIRYPTDVPEIKAWAIA